MLPLPEEEEEKFRTSAIALLMTLDQPSALQSRKWRLTGIELMVIQRRRGHAIPALTDNWIRVAASRHIPQSAKLSHLPHD